MIIHVKNDEFLELAFQSIKFILNYRKLPKLCNFGLYVHHSKSAIHIHGYSFLL